MTIISLIITIINIILPAVLLNIVKNRTIDNDKIDTKLGQQLLTVTVSMNVVSILLELYTYESQSNDSSTNLKLILNSSLIVLAIWAYNSLVNKQYGLTENILIGMFIVAISLGDLNTTKLLGK